MKIRRYVGKDAQEAILKVKMDLGSDAVIFNTRKVKQKGLKKFFTKPMVEVLAALDDDYRHSQGSVLQKNGWQRGSEDNSRISVLEEKMSNIEKMLEQLFRKQQPEEDKNTAAKADADNVPYLWVLNRFYNNLVKNDVDPDIARRIINTAASKLTRNSDINEAVQVVYSVVTNILGKPDTIKLREDGKPTVAIFVGPTGVGKTTTMAKLAANFALNEKKSVGLITADTYRIAAIDQLKTYAEILDIPLTVVYSPDEMKEALNLHRDKDLILIDTAGRCHNNRAQFDELKAVVEASRADEVFLLINSVTSLHNCREIIKHYNFLSKYKLIFTKIDETSVTGIILNARVLTGKSISYVTTGQNVPDDIETANIEKIAKNLLGSIN